MANYCYNSLSIEGKKEDINIFLNALQGELTLNLEFSDISKQKLDELIIKQILEYGDELIEARTLYDQSTENRYGQIVHQKVLQIKLKNTEKKAYFENIIPDVTKELLTDEWYHKRIRMIGSKWYPRDINIFDDEDYESKNKKSIEISFDSAWSPTLELSKKISDKYGFTIDHFFEEPGVELKGTYVFENGVLIDQY